MSDLRSVKITLVLPPLRSMRTENRLAAVIPAHSATASRLMPMARPTWRLRSGMAVE